MSFASEGTVYAIYFVMMLLVALCYTGFSVGCIDIMNLESVGIAGREVAYMLAMASATRSNTIITIPEYCGLTKDYQIQVYGNYVTIRVHSLLTGYDYSRSFRLSTHIPVDYTFNPSISTKYIVRSNFRGSLTIIPTNSADRPYI